MVDSDAEAAAAAAVVGFAESQGHAGAECYVGHWHYHGEGGLPQSDAKALVWYERAAGHGDEAAAVARDKMYLDGKVGGRRRVQGGGGLPQEGGGAAQPPEPSHVPEPRASDPVPFSLRALHQLPHFFFFLSGLPCHSG